LPFSGEFENQLQLNLKFYEDDSLGFLTFINDLIGSITLEINEDKSYQCSPDTKTTAFIEKTADGMHIFETKGSKVPYKIRLKFLQKIVI
jgi:hypothetical protein